MKKDIGVRIAFTALGLVSMAGLYFAFIFGYLFGPFAFAPPEGKPHLIFDMFFYKDYFVIGVIHLAFLAAAIMSFAVAIKPNGRLIRKTFQSYLFVVVALLLQIFWSHFLAWSRFGTPFWPNEKEKLEKSLQEKEKARYEELRRRGYFIK